MPVDPAVGPSWAKPLFLAYVLINLSSITLCFVHPVAETFWSLWIDCRGLILSSNGLRKVPCRAFTSEKEHGKQQQ